MSESAKAKGGHARAKALTAEERQASARRAAIARWEPDLPEAGYEATVDIGDSSIKACVLTDGRRVLSQAGLLRAIGRSRSPKANTGILSTADDLPFFLQAEVLRPYLPDDLRRLITPIEYVSSKEGRRAIGYDAELLPIVCEVYLKFRDACAGNVPRAYLHIVEACDMLMRGLAHVGIIALIDEATGYQEVRDRLALQAILDKFLARELASWAKRFPDEFYKQIFRLRGWEWKGMSVQRPQVVARYTNDIIYSRLAPGILEELQARNPKNSKGHRRAKHHQWLTEDVGHPALAQHLHAVIALMRASNSWQQFQTMLDLSFPKKDHTLMMPFMAEVDAR